MYVSSTNVEINFERQDRFFANLFFFCSSPEFLQDNIPKKINPISAWTRNAHS